MLARETHSLGHLDLLVTDLHFVSSDSDDTLLGSSLFKLFDPGLSMAHTLTACAVVDDHCGVSVTQVHAIQDHVSLLSRQVVQLEIHVGTQRLDRHFEVLLRHADCRCFIGIHRLVEHLLDDGGLSSLVSSDDYDLERVHDTHAHL